MNKVYNKYCWKTYNWVFIISKNIKLYRKKEEYIMLKMHYL